MKPTRFLCATLIPLCALALSLLWLQGSASADLSGVQSSTFLDKLSSELQENAVTFWPPFHENLSKSPTRDSGSVDIDTDEDRIAIVWAEGASARGLNDGVVKLAWRPSRDSAWRVRVVPQQIDGFAHFQPAVALWQQTAHIVWVRQDVEGEGRGNNRISYSACRLDTGVCSSPVAVSREEASYSRLAPDIAVDVSGTPHVVWVRQNRQQIGRIRYKNRTGGQWNEAEAVSGGNPACAYSQDNPAIALDDQHVYVVWDENVETCAEGGTAGIYFRQRDQIARPSGTGDWRPGGTPWGKQISIAGPTAEGSRANVDGFPTLDAGGGYVYVMWERFVYSQTLAFYDVYTYSLPYRVYTGTTPYNDWWPGGPAADQWAVLPFTSTSATDTADFYEGLRPSIKLVGAVPHVVWHRWDSPLETQQAILEAQGQLSSEYLVDNRNPYRVLYATHRPGTNSRNLELAQARWVSQTLRIVEQDRILASPDLALSTVDGGKTYQVHVALHQRGSYVPDKQSFGWDVWYTNNSKFQHYYMPILIQGRP